MASMSFILLTLALIAVTVAAPVPDDVETTTVLGDELVEIVEVVEAIPVLTILKPSTPEAKEAEHKVAKRSALRGDNPSNDLLADFDGVKFENGLSSFDGRRIKFLPTWLG